MVGKPEFLRNEKITGLEPLEASAVKLQEEGKTAMFVAIDGKPAGILAVADPIKSTTAEAIRDLHALGMQLVMLTGDNRRTADAVAKELGLDAVVAEIEPAGKVAHVKKLRAEGKHVAMAGDGINDAPALSEAEVGIAMGTGTDVAMQSAGITLVKGDLRGIAKAIRLSRATMRNIRQNLFFAFLYNALGIPLAAGVLYPFFGLLLSPIIAGAAMSLSSVSVIGNALRLQECKAVNSTRNPDIRTALRIPTFLRQSCAGETLTIPLRASARVPEARRRRNGHHLKCRRRELHQPGKGNTLEPLPVRV